MNRSKYLTFFLFLFFFPTLRAQQKAIDSLKTLLSNTQPDTSYVIVAHNLSRAYTWVNADSADSYINDALILAHQLNFQKGLSWSYNQKGTVEYVRGNYLGAISWMDSSMVIREELNDRPGEIRMINNIAVMYKSLGDTESAMKMYFQGLDKSDSYELEHLKGDLYNNIAIIHYNQRKLDSAAFYYEKSLKVFETSENQAKQALILNNLGNVFYIQSDYFEALSYYKQAFEVAEKADDTRTRVMSLSNLSLIYGNVGLVNEAIESLEKLLTHYNQSGEVTRQSGVLQNLANNYLRNKELDKAENYINQAIQKKLDTDSDGLDRAYITLSKIYEAKNNEELSVLFAKNAHEISVKTGNKHVMIFANNIFARQFLKEQKYLDAKKVLEENIRISGDKNFPDVLKWTYLHLSNAYAGLNQPVKSLEAQKSAMQFQDSLLNNEKLNAIVRNRIEFQTREKELEAALSKEKLKVVSNELTIKKAETKFYYSILSASLLIIGIISWWRISSLRKTSALAVKEKEDEKVKAQELTLELKKKEKEIVSKALELAEKNEILSSFKANIHKSALTSDPSLIQHSVDSLEKSLKLSDNNWNAFKTSFEAMYGSFFDNLLKKYPALTPRELQLCALIRLNLSIKEMSNILGISKDSIKTARYRIRKKLGINDSDTNLTSFLATS